MKKRRWLFRMPRHHAENTSRPAPGKRILVSITVSSRFSPVKPLAITATSHGAVSTPVRTISEATSASIPATAPASRVASFSSPLPRSPAYSGMKEADRTPSPKRFCSMFGIRNAALNASAARPAPR